MAVQLIKKQQCTLRLTADINTSTPTVHTHKDRPYLSGVRCCCCRGVSSRLWAAAGGSGRRTEPAGWQYRPLGAGGAEGPLGVAWAGWGWRGRGRGAEPGAAAAEPHTEIMISLMLHFDLKQSAWSKKNKKLRWWDKQKELGDKISKVQRKKKHKEHHMVA